MNVTEGMRRLGILLGVCGGILGGWLAYGDAKSTWERRIEYRKFAFLMASPIMQNVAKAARELKATGATLVSVDLDGIKQVTVDKAGLVSSIELSTGECVRRIEAPRVTVCLGILLYPILGLLLPWGAVRIVMWVRAGFFAPSQ
jgi:hypothetical protein